MFLNCRSRPISRAYYVFVLLDTFYLSYKAFRLFSRLNKVFIIYYALFIEKVCIGNIITCCLTSVHLHFVFVGTNHVEVPYNTANSSGQLSALGKICFSFTVSGVYF